MRERRTGKLTELGDAALLFDRLETASGELDREAERVALFYIDVEGLDAVMERLGKDAGDAVRREAVRRLAQVADEGDTLVRVGPDDFALLTTGARAERPAQLASRLMAIFSVPYRWHREPIGIRVGVGVATSSGPVGDGDAFLAEAGRARGTVDV